MGIGAGVSVAQKQTLPGCVPRPQIGHGVDVGGAVRVGRGTVVATITSSGPAVAIAVTGSVGGSVGVTIGCATAGASDGTSCAMA